MLGIEDINKKSFTRKVRGYSEQEVDAFLDLVSASIIERDNDIDRLKEELRQMTERFEQLHSIEGVLRDTLVNAQVSAERTVGDANAKASKINEDAQQQAYQMLEEANTAAIARYNEAQRQADAMVYAARAERDSVMEDIAQRSEAAIRDARTQSETMIEDAKRDAVMMNEDAKRQSQTMINDAKRESDALIKAAQDDYKRESEMNNRLRRESAAMYNDVSDALKRHLTLLEPFAVYLKDNEGISANASDSFAASNVTTEIKDAQIDPLICEEASNDAPDMVTGNGILTDEAECVAVDDADTVNDPVQATDDGISSLV